MNRRTFSRTVLSTVGGAYLYPTLSTGATPGQAGIGPPSAGTGSRSGTGLQAMPAIDGRGLNRWLSEMSRFGRREDGGVDRVAFSNADLEARSWLQELMEDSGLQVSVDVAGNILGRRVGAGPPLPPLMVGSHIDSVPAGGNYDGPVGCLAAVEVLRTLREAGIVTRHPLEVVIFVNEEGGKTGSRAMAGKLRSEELDLRTASGFTIGEGIQRLGGDPTRLEEALRKPGDSAGYLELHIEQGAILEREERRIGVVEGIVGIRRWTATVTGAANHAGTTPMAQRRDALLGAARLIEAVNRVVSSFPGSPVGTVGRIEAHPGAPNVIPGEVSLSIELRALAMETIQEVMEGIRTEAEHIGRENGTPITLEEFYRSEAAPTDERFRSWIEEACESRGFSHRRMPSGAGHDAQSVAHFAPMGMIFIPSVGGLSHHPNEYSRPEDVGAGADVLLDALLQADSGLS